MLKLKQSQEAKDIMEKNSKIAQEKATNDQFLLTLELSKINGELQNLKEENQSLQGQIVTLKKEKSSCME
jgi:predicted RNase H-like nuclease (RuvC/YqgF family)